VLPGTPAPLRWQLMKSFHHQKRSVPARLKINRLKEYRWSRSRWSSALDHLSFGVLHAHPISARKLWRRWELAACSEPRN